MILIDTIKYFISLDNNQKFNNKFPFGDLEALLAIISIDDFIPILRDKLSEYNFKEAVQLEIGDMSNRFKNFFFFKEENNNHIAFWITEGNLPPIMFDIDDILFDDLEYNILKYGKILLRPIEIS